MNSDWTDAELMDLYHERAAIREYDGGEHRKSAEWLAYWDWRKLVGSQINAPRELQALITKLAKERRGGRQSEMEF